MICVSKMFMGFLLIGICIYICIYLQISEVFILKKKEKEMCAIFFNKIIDYVSTLHLARILLHMNFTRWCLQ